MIYRSKIARKNILLLLDIIGIIFSFIISGVLRHHNMDWFYTSLYTTTLLVIILVYAFVFLTSEEIFQDIINIGYFQNFLTVFRNQVILLIITVIYLFITKQGSIISRSVVGYFFFINILVDYIIRIYLKKYFYRALTEGSSAIKIMLVTLSDRAEDILKKMQESSSVLKFSSIVILDKNRVGEQINGIPIVGNSENILTTHKNYVYDEVFIHIPYDSDIHLEEIILGFEQMGITVNLNIEMFGIDIGEKTINSFGKYKTISFTSKSFNATQMMVKRFFDILGSVFGLCLVGIFYLIFAPIIKLESKGPVFFSQTRIGINGRRFKIYKFRSMYVDAEEQKKHLMNQNQMEGYMFKMKDDPRITKVGKILRKTSIDELPQFYNVLLGDMSMVGTRPPTEDEYCQYQNYHMRRLSIRPGITGLWQVSGRNTITNFEDVVKMDLQYIDQWSLLLDLKLLLMTVGVVIFGKGAE